MFEKIERRFRGRRREDRSRAAEPQKAVEASGDGKPSLMTRIIRGWRPWHTMVGLALLFLCTLGAGLVKATWDRICLGDRCPSIAQITVWEPEESSKLFAADGSLIHEF